MVGLILIISYRGSLDKTFIEKFFIRKRGI